MLVSSDVWKRLFPASSSGGGGGGGGAGKKGLLSSGSLFNNYNNNNIRNRRRSNTTIMDQLLVKLNPMRLCAGLKVLGYFMVVLVVAIIGISYYAVVVITWGPRLLDGGANSFFSFLILVLFHFLLVLLTWCYLMVVLRDPGSVPENWKLVSLGDIEEGNTAAVPSSDPQNLAPTVASLDGVELESAVRYCNTCRNGKPPRCHHCSICQRCVLKMDHHCIWVVNCVGAQNYKFFLLFVFYTFLETMLDTLALLPSFINFFEQAKHRSSSPADLAVTFLAFVLNLAFALSLLCFVVMHTSLLLGNTTSVEVHEKKRTTRWKYDLGRKRNFEQVFGTKKLFWFFPLFSGDDLKNIPALHGLEFPICSDTGVDCHCDAIEYRSISSYDAMISHGTSSVLTPLYPQQ
ncbi:OLC1v1038332C1 [Oldenlandia corymbosa var. corymbosa]|uniref:S-acyltransferase n=1 Tax=Oldenlandia corymbosa var. corymbosa TaxID=529605 RepID=A0AAV1D0G6_OLDCO|nr:OLC1v1038332C1 [Oldenlandia corymbosa var. corymbosa]